MKYILPSIGAIVGLFVLSLFGDGLWLYPGAFLGALAGTGLLVALSRRPGLALSNSNKKLKAKELLATHQEETFSSWSLAQLKNFKEQLGRSGLMMQFDTTNFSCSMDDSWQGLAESEKVALYRFGYHYCLKATTANDKGYFTVHVPKGDCSSPKDEHYIYVTSKKLLLVEEPLLPKVLGHVTTIVDVDHSPRDETIKSLITKDLSRAESKVIKLYYFENTSEAKIGAKLGFSKAEVSQMRASIIKRLKERLAKHRKNQNEASSD